jgi:hypothetical protein
MLEEFTHVNAGSYNEELATREKYFANSLVQKM